MHDFQDSLRRMLFEAEEGPTPLGPPEGPFNIGHHDGHMNKAGESGAASEVIKQHLQAQALEYNKLKTAYDALVKTVQAAFDGLGTYGIEDKGFMKGRMAPMAAPQQQGQVSNPSQAAAMGAAQQFRQRMQKPIDTSADDI